MDEATDLGTDFWVHAPIARCDGGWQGVDADGAEALVGFFYGLQLG